MNYTHLPEPHQAGSHTLQIVLFALGFALQVAGAGLVVLEMSNDKRTAQRLARESLPVTWANIEGVGTSMVEYFAGRRWQRWLGVVLILLGAAVSLAANITAL